jgi:hypothetical protein
VREERDEHPSDQERYLATEEFVPIITVEFEL